MNESRWARRRIRKGGRVKVGGKWYRPESQHMKYDGRLDGMMYVFGRYRQCNGGYLPLLDMWGTLQMYQAATDPKREEEYKRLWNNMLEVVDGHLPWVFWHEEHDERCVNETSV